MENDESRFFIAVVVVIIAITVSIAYISEVKLSVKLKALEIELVKQQIILEQEKKK